jgi:hypothetical protein
MPWDTWFHRAPSPESHARSHTDAAPRRDRLAFGKRRDLERLPQQAERNLTQDLARQQGRLHGRDWTPQSTARLTAQEMGKLHGRDWGGHAAPPLRADRSTAIDHAVLAYGPLAYGPQWPKIAAVWCHTHGQPTPARTPHTLIRSVEAWQQALASWEAHTHRPERPPAWPQPQAARDPDRSPSPPMGW